MLISSLLFGISASLDALLVGVSYGIRHVRIRFWQNLVISLVTLLGTCLSVSLGHRLIPFLPSAIRGCAGSLILILLGLYYIIKWLIAFLQEHRLNTSSKTGLSHEITTASAKESLSANNNNTTAAPIYGVQTSLEKENTPEGETIQPEKAAASQLKLAEVFALSLTLSLNNLSAGLSASLAGLTLLPTAVSTMVCSVLFLFSGNRLGQNPVLRFAGRAADPISGALLIGLGIVQLFL